MTEKETEKVAEHICEAVEQGRKQERARILALDVMKEDDVFADEPILTYRKVRNDLRAKLRAAIQGDL